MESIGYERDFIRRHKSATTNIASRKRFITAKNTVLKMDPELVLLRSREHLVQKREEELQRLCHAVENICNKNVSITVIYPFNIALFFNPRCN